MLTAIAVIAFVSIILSAILAVSSPGPAKYAAARAFNIANMASFTIGTKSSNTIKVTVQLLDALGRSVPQLCMATVYLSDNSDGHTLTATATTSAIAIATEGVILSTLTTEKAVLVLSNTSGAFDLNIIQTASQTYYMVVVMPDGSVVVSDAITF